MKARDWRRTGIEGLIIGAAVYVTMRFLVPHRLDSNSRSLIGAVVTFCVAFIVLGLGRSQQR